MLLAIGTRVRHSGHGLGAIVAHNGQAALTIGPRPQELLEGVVANGLVQPLVSGMFYNAERYPYVVQFESGFREVYAERELDVL